MHMTALIRMLARAVWTIVREGLREGFRAPDDEHRRDVRPAPRRRADAPSCSNSSSVCSTSSFAFRLPTPLGDLSRGSRRTSRPLRRGPSSVIAVVTPSWRLKKRQTRSLSKRTVFGRKSADRAGDGHGHLRSEVAEITSIPIRRSSASSMLVTWRAGESSARASGDLRCAAKGFRKALRSRV